MTFGQRIKELRLKNNITQQDLSKVLNVARATVGRYETDERFPDKDILNKLADYFDVSVDFLLGRTEISNPDKISEAIKDDPELLDFYNEMKERENLKLLLKQTKAMDDNGIRQILRIIKAIEDEEDANA